MNATLLTLMLAAPRPYGDSESAEARAVRLETVSEAVELETAEPPPGWRWGVPELQGLVLSTTFEEGARWSLAVHDGSKTGDAGRARCLGQLHQHFRWMPRDRWLASVGTDLESTRTCIRGVVDVLEHYAATCVTERGAASLEPSLARVVAGYGTGRTCSTVGRPWAERRARLAVKWARALRKSPGEVAA